MDYAALRAASDDLRKPLTDLFANNASGEARRMLGSPADQLLAQLDQIASQIKTANFQSAGIGADMQDAVDNASNATSSAADASAGLFIGLAQNRASDERSALYRTLALLIAATVAALFIVALISRGITNRLANLVRVMDQISRKDLSVDVPYLTDSQ